MKQLSLVLLLSLMLTTLCASISAAAEEVRVFQPKIVSVEGEKPRELSPSELRREALLLGFSEAVMQAAIKLLPQAPSDARAQALRSFLEPQAREWVLGYKEVASRATPDGLNMVLEVDVNRRALRDTVESLGLHRPAGQPQYVTILPGPTLLEADKAALTSIMQLVNAVDRPGFGPRISLERMESGTLRGQLESDRGGWTAMDADVPSVWFALWDKYHSLGVSKASGGIELTVTGWFTPDGANDFDRVLQNWDELVRSARLLEMDLATAGVSARWSIQPLDLPRLQEKLRAYLPPRGLEFSVQNSL